MDVIGTENLEFRAISGARSFEGSRIMVIYAKQEIRESVERKESKNTISGGTRAFLLSYADVTLSFGTGEKERERERMFCC